MAKPSKSAEASAAPKRPPPPQQAILSRLSFLHQAASLLSLPEPQGSSPSSSSPSSPGLARYYNSHLLSVSKKSVQRLSPAVKHTICRRCASLLVPGVSSVTRVENKSKGGRKAWADVLVVECKTCGAIKRFPTIDKEEVKARKMKNMDKKLNKEASVVTTEGDVAMAGT